jgi:hypothetical protein
VGQCIAKSVADDVSPQESSVRYRPAERYEYRIGRVVFAQQQRHVAAANAVEMNVPPHTPQPHGTAHITAHTHTSFVNLHCTSKKALLLKPGPIGNVNTQNDDENKTQIKHITQTGSLNHAK